MTFETMDWEAEAERIRRAFDIRAKCQFRLGDNRYHRYVPLNSTADLREHILLSEKPNQPLYSSLIRRRIDVLYTPYGRSFEIQLLDSEEGVSLSWNGNVLSPPPATQGTTFARAFFHLDLLTPEVEAALQVSISSHQKLEWALEYEA